MGDWSDMWGVGLICEGLVLNSSERFGGRGKDRIVLTTEREGVALVH